MDFVDILITIGIFAIFIGSEVLKIKKKMASSTSPKPASIENLEEDFEHLDEDYFAEKEKLKNENFTQKSSKSTSYFTYEDTSPSEEVVSSSEAAQASTSAEKSVQGIENETERLNIDLHDPEEIKKAIIYGEILKNPYN